VNSLQLRSKLGERLEKLKGTCCQYVGELVLELPHVLPTADVVVKYSYGREVVLVGGLRRWAFNGAAVNG
jgi:hypothetical protein